MTSSVWSDVSRRSGMAACGVRRKARSAASVAAGSSATVWKVGTSTTPGSRSTEGGTWTAQGFRLAGATPGQMFFVLATIGVLHLLVMYAITNVAAVRFTGSGGRRWTQLASVVGVVVAAAVLVQNLLSAPVALLVTITLWLALGVVVGGRAGRRL